MVAPGAICGSSKPANAQFDRSVKSSPNVIDPLVVPSSESIVVRLPLKIHFVPSHWLEVSPARVFTVTDGLINVRLEARLS